MHEISRHDATKSTRLRIQSLFILSGESGRLEILEAKRLSAADYTSINEVPINVKEWSIQREDLNYF